MTPPASANSATLLVVDDDPGLRRLVEKTLRRAGRQTAGAGSAAEALDWLESNAAELMLLDLQLPDAAGADVVERLEAAGKSLPFVVITGQGDERVAVEMMKRGAADYLVKDKDFLEFLPSVVERVLTRVLTEKRLAATEEQLRQAEKELLEATSREQQRIGQDLHDGLGQQLAGIELLSHVLEEELTDEGLPQARQAAKIAARVREAISHTRLLARGLSPVHVEADGLMSALRELAASVEEIFKVRCQFSCPEPVLFNDNSTATHLYRIAQEATNNAIKHGKAKSVSISLLQKDGVRKLEIEDDGSGFPGKLDTKGIGLRIMNRRALMIGGKFDIRPREKGGIAVICTVPPKA